MWITSPYTVGCWVIAVAAAGVGPVAVAGWFFLGAGAEVGWSWYETFSPPRFRFGTTKSGRLVVYVSLIRVRDDQISAKASRARFVFACKRNVCACSFRDKPYPGSNGAAGTYVRRAAHV